MKGTISQLQQQLKTQCLPIYLLASDEIVLQQEAITQIRMAAKKANIHLVRQRILQEENDGKIFYEIAKQPDLFSGNEATLWILNCYKNKFNAQESAYLLEYLMAPSSNHVVILCMSKLDAHQSKSKWYVQLEKIGMVVTLWPPRAHEWNDWLAQRLRQANIHLSASVFAKIAYNTQGHLLAATQLIEQLALLQPLTDEMALSLCTDQAEVDLYTWLDSWLVGAVPDSLRLWLVLRRQGLELSLVIWTLMKTLQDLLKMHRENKQILPAWRAGLMQQALKRYNQIQCSQWLQQLQALDCAHKKNEPAQWIADQLTLILYNETFSGVEGAKSKYVKTI